MAAFASVGVVACGDDTAIEPADTTTTTTTTATSTTVAPDTTPASTEPATTEPTTTEPATTTSAPEEVVPDRPDPVVWLLLEEVLLPVRGAASVDETSDAGEPAASIAEALRAWLAGPTEQQIADGYATAAPAGTRLLGVEVADRIVTVDLSGEFASGGGSAAMLARLAELVMVVTTATPVPDPPTLPDGEEWHPLGGVGPGVVLRLDGVEVTTFSGEGIELDGPLTVDDASDWLPIIVADSVLAGDEVTDGLAVAGWANVFEAVVSYEVLDDVGGVLDEGFTMATCGTGCRGWFSIPLEVGDHLGPATIVLYEVSSMDGSRVNVVELPVTVVAPGA